MSDQKIRINRYLAGCGLGSRRKCEKYVTEGNVRINGKKISDLALKVDPYRDKVTVQGETVCYAEEKIVLVLNKPEGVVCSVSDDLGRRTVVDIAKEKGYRQRLFPVGRLDMDTTGILLLTNDGELTNRMIHPRYHVEKVYTVDVQGEISGETASRIAEGVDIGGYVTRPCGIEILSGMEKRSRLKVTIKEGKKRQIRRMFLSYGHPVIKLHRKSIGGLEFEDLDKGQLRPLNPDEESYLRRMIESD